MRRNRASADSSSTSDLDALLARQLQAEQIVQAQRPSTGSFRGRGRGIRLGGQNSSTSSGSRVTRSNTWQEYMDHMLNDIGHRQHQVQPQSYDDDDDNYDDNVYEYSAERIPYHPHFAPAMTNTPMRSLMHREIDENDYALLLQLEDVPIASKGATEIEISMLPTFRFGLESRKRPNLGYDEDTSLKKQKDNRESNPIIIIDGNEVIEILEDDEDKDSAVPSSSSSSSSCSQCTTLSPSTENTENCSENKKCCICLEVYQVGDEIMRLPCLHFFTEIAWCLGLPIIALVPSINFKSTSDNYVIICL
jgi:hypothetical protein